MISSAALLTSLALIQSATSMPQLLPRQNNNCNVTFSRFSKQDAGSFLATIEHVIVLTSFEEGKESVPISRSSCWNVVNWGKGCTWNNAERTSIDKGWTIQHEGYSAYGDYDSPVQIHGNGCEGTVLTCKGDHSHYTLPNPGNPNGGGQYFYISNTECALAGQNAAALLGSNIKGQELTSLLQGEGNMQGFNGDFSTLKDDGEVPAPAPYHCTHFPVSESVCTPFYECVDNAPTPAITAYFADSASMASTMSTVPTVAPISSPAPCSSPPATGTCNCNEDGCTQDSPACCANGTC